MANKVNIADFVKFFEQQYNEKAGYVMSSYGQNPRTGYLDLNETRVKSAWKPSGWYYAGQYSGKQLEQALYWREHCKRVFDCNGVSEAFYELKTGICINARARNNYAEWCDPKGTGMIPTKYRVPGAAIFAETLHIRLICAVYIQVIGINGSYYSAQRGKVMERAVKLIGLNHHAAAPVAYHKVTAYVLEYAAQERIAALGGSVKDICHH